LLILFAAFGGLVYFLGIMIPHHIITNDPQFLAVC
jgi:hypothetical protein